MLYYFLEISKNIDPFVTRNFQKPNMKVFVEREAQINPGCSSKDPSTSQCNHLARILRCASCENVTKDLALSFWYAYSEILIGE